MKQRALAAARYLIAGLLIYWLSRSGVVDWGVVRDRVRDWPSLLVPFALLVASLGTMSWRLVALLRGRGLVLSLADGFRLSLVGTLFNLVLPAGGGDVARFWYASASASGRRTEIAAILGLDRIIGLLTLLATPLLALPVAWDLIRGSPALMSVVAFAALVVTTLVIGLACVIGPAAGPWAPVRWFASRLPYQVHVQRLVGAVRGYRDRPGALARATLASFLTHVLSAVAVALMYLRSAEGPAAVVGMVTLFGFVANSLPITPGGLGVGEAAFEALFNAVGQSGGAEALLAWRILLLALAPAGLLVHLRGLRVTLAAESP